MIDPFDLLNDSFLLIEFYIALKPPNIDFNLLFLDQLSIIQVNQRVSVVLFSHQQLGTQVVADEMLVILSEAVIVFRLSIIDSMGRAVIAVLQEEARDFFDGLIEVPKFFHAFNFHGHLLQISVEVEMVLWCTLHEV